MEVLAVSPEARPLARTAREKIAEGLRLKDQANVFLKDDQPKKAAVKFKTCFAYTRGLLPQFSALARYANLSGQGDNVIDMDQQVAVRALELACNEGLATIYLRSGDHEKALGYSEKVALLALLYTLCVCVSTTVVRVLLYYCCCCVRFPPAAGLPTAVV